MGEPKKLRSMTYQRNYTKYSAGSVLINVLGIRKYYVLPQSKKASQDFLKIKV